VSIISRFVKDLPEDERKELKELPRKRSRVGHFCLAMNWMGKYESMLNSSFVSGGLL